MNLPRYVFGGERAMVRSLGEIGIVVVREFRPDCWDHDPLRLVMLKGKRRQSILVAVRPDDLEIPSEEAPRKLIDEAWEFMERRARTA